MTTEAAKVLQEFYLDLRKKYRSVDSTPITTRQLESMIRLSEARAKLELREKVTSQDAKEIVEIMFPSPSLSFFSLFTFSVLIYDFN